MFCLPCRADASGGCGRTESRFAQVSQARTRRPPASPPPRARKDLIARQIAREAEIVCLHAAGKRATHFSSRRQTGPLTSLPRLLDRRLDLGWFWPLWDRPGQRLTRSETAQPMRAPTMARRNCAEVVVADEVGVYHCVQRVVRRAFLCGDDPLSGISYDHRRTWIRDRLEALAGLFGVEVAAFAVLSNHVHVILRIRPDVAPVFRSRCRAAMAGPLRFGPSSLRRGPEPGTRRCVVAASTHPTGLPAWRSSTRRDRNHTGKSKKCAKYRNRRQNRRNLIIGAWDS